MAGCKAQGITDDRKANGWDTDSCRTLVALAITASVLDHVPSHGLKPAQVIAIAQAIEADILPNTSGYGQACFPKRATAATVNSAEAQAAALKALEAMK